MDGDGDLEIIALTQHGWLNIWNNDGTLSNSRVFGYYAPTSDYSGFAVGDIDNDGQGEIVFGGADGWLYVVNHTGGDEVGWPINLNADRTFSTPSLADINKDGKMEIFIGHTSGYVWAYHHNGTALPGWGIKKSEAIYAPPAIADIDNDGELEIIVGESRPSEQYSNLSAWEINGSYITGWPRELEGAIWSAPAIGDMDNDGNLDIAITTIANAMYVLESNGNNKVGLWPRYLDYIYTSPALGDIDNDGNLEVIITSFPEVGDNYETEVHAFESDGNYVSGNWPIYMGDNSYSDLVWQYNHPVIADINNDNYPEILIGNWGGYLYAYEQTGSILTGWPKYLGYKINSTPVVADVDKDKYVDILVGQLGRMVAYSLSSKYNESKAAWPEYAHDSRNSGLYQLPCGSTLSGNLTLHGDMHCLKDGLIVNADNIMIDCKGFRIKGDGRNITGGETSDEYGIKVYGRNVTIKNCVIEDFYYGIYLGYGSENVTINNSAVLSNAFGIRLFQSHNASIDSNQIIDNYYSIYSSYSNQTRIKNNEINISGYLIYVVASNNYDISYNNFTSTGNHVIVLNSDSNHFNISYNNFWQTSQYFIRNINEHDVSAAYNYWNTTNRTLIEERIYDRMDNAIYGEVEYCPFLEASYPTEQIETNCNEADQSNKCKDGLDNDNDTWKDEDDSDCCDLEENFCNASVGEFLDSNVDCGLNCNNSFDFEWANISLQSRWCCGDDGNEFLTYFAQYDLSCDTAGEDITNELCVGTVPSDEDDDVCALTSSDCAFNQTAYSDGYGFTSNVDIDNDGRYGEFCSDTKWMDCDYWALDCIVTNKCGGIANNVYWATGGESNPFGEYDSGKDTECCGDDAGEYLIYNGEITRCCGNADDIVNASGSCVGS